MVRLRGLLGSLKWLRWIPLDTIIRRWLLIKVINKYESEIGQDASKFKETLIESLSDYLEEYIAEAVPADAILEATQNRTAMEVLSNLRKVLAVDSSLMSESVKEAVMDGKSQIDQLTEKLIKTQECFGCKTMVLAKPSITCDNCQAIFWDIRVLENHKIWCDRS